MGQENETFEDELSQATGNTPSSLYRRTAGFLKNSGRAGSGSYYSAGGRYHIKRNAVQTEMDESAPTVSIGAISRVELSVTEHFEHLGGNIATSNAVNNSRSSNGSGVVKELMDHNVNKLGLPSYLAVSLF